MAFESFIGALNIKLTDAKKHTTSTNEKGKDTIGNHVKTVYLQLL